MTPITIDADHDCAWKDAILDAAVVEWTLAPGHDSNPRAAVNALLNTAAEQALNPTISEPAAKLHAEIAALRVRVADLLVEVGTLRSQLADGARDR